MHNAARWRVLLVGFATSLLWQLLTGQSVAPTAAFEATAFGQESSAPQVKAYSVTSRPLERLAELNKDIKPFGGRDEQELVRIIKDTVLPQASSAAAAAPASQPVEMSSPVNGLRVGIDLVTTDYLGFVVFLRLTNVGDHPLIGPGLGQHDANGNNACEVQANIGGRWQKAAKDSDDSKADGEEATHYVIGPGQSRVVCIRVDRENAVAKCSNIRVILRSEAAARKDRWHGVLETPPFDPWKEQNERATHCGKLPFPDHFPQFCRYPLWLNQSPDAALSPLISSNLALARALRQYEPQGVRRELEERLAAEEDPTVKLLVAVLGAEAGSEKGALYLLEAMKSLDMQTVVAVHEALCHLLWEAGCYKDVEAPQWLIALTEAALSDRRWVKAGRHDGWSSESEPQDSFRRVGEITCCGGGEKLLSAFASRACRKALPFVLEILKQTGPIEPGELKSSEPGMQMEAIYVLGKMNDSRAVPALVELLRQADARAPWPDDNHIATEYYRLVSALGELKAVEAVPLLAKHLEYPHIVSTLGTIASSSAIEALRRLCDANGEVIRDGRPVLPTLREARLFQARLALAHLEDGNAVQRLSDMLAATSNEQQRHAIVCQLCELDDIRVVPVVLPVLAETIKTSKDHSRVLGAISRLSKYRSKAVVEALINCFDGPFSCIERGKTGCTVERVQDEIALSLRRITGHSLGRDKEQWLKWWREEGSRSSALKWPRTLPGSFHLSPGHRQ